MKTKSRIRIRRAFTLVELLVTIAVIIIVGTLLIGALGSARARAHRVVCLSNMRQLALAVSYYSTDNRGIYPPFIYDATSVSNGSYALTLNPNCSTANIGPGAAWSLLRCPSDSTPDMIGAIDSSGNRINVPVSYGYNFLPFIQDGRALSMQRPPKTVLLFDGHPGAATSGYWWGATVTCAPGPDGTVTICHKPGTPAEQTLQIPPPALGGHMGHDDYCGPCGGGASANLQRISAANYPALRHLEKLNVIFFDCHGEVLSALPDDGFNF